jgi:hypothetical protein
MFSWLNEEQRLSNIGGMMAKSRKNNKKQHQKSAHGVKQTKNRRQSSPLRTDQVEIPLTGGMSAAAGGQVDEIDISDLIDLSDVEDMQKRSKDSGRINPYDLVDGDAEQMSRYADDRDAIDDLTDRQNLVSGTDQLIERLSQHTGEAPVTSAEDIDADWDSDQQSGEESVSGSVSTPEQNVVDHIGEALGVEYDDYEPLDTQKKLDSRDENRWELNPESADDETSEEKGGDDLNEEEAEKKYNHLMDDITDQDETEGGS